MIRIRSGAAALSIAVLLAGSALALAASTGGGGERKGQEASAESPGADEADGMYERGLQLAEEGKFAEALARFEQANRKRKDDPQILNMLAFCQRKTGDLDAAFANYAKALELRPRFPQAREYLGEAHLQAALAQLEILRGYGPDGEKELQQLVSAIRRAAAGVYGEAGAESGNW